METENNKTYNLALSFLAICCLHWHYLDSFHYDLTPHKCSWQCFLFVLDLKAFKGTCVTSKLDPEYESKLLSKTIRGTLDFFECLMAKLTLRYMILHFWSAGRMALYSKLSSVSRSWLVTWWLFLDVWGSLKGFLNPVIDLANPPPPLL